MPKVTRSKRDAEFAAADAEWQAFSDATAWSESKNKPGNYWRNWDGRTVTIFRRKDGKYGWCIADDDARQFSSRSYPDFDMALSGLSFVLGIDFTSES